MSDIALLAQEAMNVIGPVLPMAASYVAGHLADGFMSEPGAKLFDWLASKFKGTSSATTLERAVAEPGNERRLSALRLEIEEIADKNEEFREQLGALLKQIGGDTINATAPQTATQTGDNNKNAQVIGKKIKIQF